MTDLNVTKKMFPYYSQCFISSVHTHILINYSEILKNIIESNRIKSNRIPSIIIKTNQIVSSVNRSRPNTESASVV